MSVPPAFTVTAAGTFALALAFVMSSEIAAATLIGPAEVDADGVLVPPEPVPPAALDALSAWLRSPAT
ncbi:MAG TPA: hypothetical protein VJQ09_07220 [Candidatus Limnocylindria bacterium]|nr:hypothetical protein [Candidatus Limnocylindria bacterium]